MFNVLHWLAAAFLVLHGLVHLMGTFTYLRLGRVQGLPYKTTLLGGRWPIGERGIAAFGALWAAGALAFVLAATALIGDWPSARAVIIAAALFSLVLTVFDWSVAYAGAVLNVLILVFASIAPAMPRLG